MTASTASTATPPKLLDGELSFVGDSPLGSFGDMFNGVGGRSSHGSNSPHDSQQGVRIADRVSSCQADLQQNPPYFSNFADGRTSEEPSPIPRPLNIDRTQEMASSPYSYTSHDSRDNLMGSPVPYHHQSSTSPSSPVRRKALAPSQSMPIRQIPSSPSRSAYAANTESNGRILAKSPSPIVDEDARLLASSVQPREATNPRNMPIETRQESKPANAAKDDHSDNEELLFSTPSPNRPNISRTAPKKSPPSSFRPLNIGIDSSLADSVRIAAQFEANAPAQEKAGKKVMTPAQFERYRQQQELSRNQSDPTGKDDSDGENDNYEDEDETERDRQAAKQRKKQEAHLAVYRQTMMKVTGENPSGPATNGQSGRLTSLSTPELGRMSRLTVGTGISSHSGKSSGTDEEDEDVPLGILQAHGFPNKNKPPSRLQTSLSNSNLKGNPVSAPPASVSGESRAGARGGLPVFARNLPQDPYYGASLVNAPHRESFAMGGGQSGFAGVAQGQVHPSGLVGVIAGEERARAMRRGSPNQVNIEGVPPNQHPGMMRSQTMGNVSTMNGFPGPAMPGMMSPQALSPGDQAQIQMAQQMNQMMQMQMQWMQQMTQMQQSGPMGQMPPPPQMQMPNLMGGIPGDMGSPGQRPFSMPLPDPSRQNGRAMSLTPAMTAQWNRNSSYAPSLGGGQAYAPSIAPSERSNIGMASRYRPVSIAPDLARPANDRASTFTSGTFSPWLKNDQGRLSPSNTNTTVRPNSSGLGQKPATTDDEDDDQGWADMKKKRDKKKGLWRTKKGEKSG
jgi:hypothetical protein